MESNNQLMVEHHDRQVALRIKDALRGPEKTVEGMANFADISRQAVYKWQRTGNISRANLIKLAQYTGRDPDWFLSGHDHAREPEAPYHANTDRMVNAIALFDELVPLALARKIPARERAKAIQLIYQKTTADGSLNAAEVLGIVKRLKAKYEGG